MNRRQFLVGLCALGASSLAVSGLRYWPTLDISNPCLSQMPDELKQHPLMQQIWQGINTSLVWDSHAHIIGAGNNGGGVWYNADMDSWLHPVLKIQKKFYMNGGCITTGHEDETFMARMLHLSADMPAGYKTMLFAFDWAHNEQGEPEKSHSIFHIPDSYAANLATEYPQYFEWVASIHPYRPDALDALESAKANGARAIKWLPSGMRIDPSSQKCDKFYQKLAELNMPIISHTGRESAVKGGDQSFGNPLHMRRALDAGVRVVLAHCASDGDDEDLDNHNHPIKSFELFARIMDNPAYANLAFGEISAITLLNHAWVIKPLLQRTDWHHRLFNGSDYPLPGIMPLISSKQLQRAGLLDESHVLFLQTLRDYNPLMFDFAVKRLIKFEDTSFAANIFETRPFFDASVSSSHQKLIT
jgi:uncharacterized protein